MRMPMSAAGDVAPANGQPRPGAGRLARLRAQARRTPALARQHWLFTALLALGLALLYIDSTKYLLGAYPGGDPPGYQVALKPFVALFPLNPIAAIQHLLGL